MEYKLKNVAEYSNKKINIDQINCNNYISTENMLPNKSGIAVASSLPNQNKVCYFEKNNILISNIRPYFKKIWFANYEGGCSNDVLNIRVSDTRKVLPKFLYYVLFQDKFFDYIMSGNKGTKMPRGYKKHIMNYTINLPNIETQIKIINILENIDKKIELNNLINDNLHELCKNLYIELVNQLDDTNSAIQSIKNVAKCLLGGTPSRAKEEYWNGSINWINSGEINKFRIIEASEKITELGLNKSSTTLLPKETTVLAITGATLGQVSRLEIDACANQSVIGIITNDKELNNYMYLSILNTINDLKLKQTGGAQQHINKNDVETHEIIVPNKELIFKFDETIKPLFKQISVNCFEIEKLEQLRDTLLPKLMNGDINLDKVNV